jgi:hypothetical protein
MVFFFFQPSYFLVNQANRFDLPCQALCCHNTVLVLPEQHFLDAHAILIEAVITLSKNIFI